MSALVAPRRPLLRLGVTLGVLALLAAFLLSAPRYRYEWGRIWGEEGAAAYLLGGLLTTAWVSALALVLGLLLGLLGGLARLSRSAVLQQLGVLYVEIVRGTPFLIQVIVAWFCFAPALREASLAVGLPAAAAGLFDDRVFVGVVALGVCSGAYVTEIVRAAVESVDRGQTEAALSQGMSYAQALRHVLLPQALRRMLPPLAGELVTLVKDSSILSFLAVSELAKRGSEMQSRTYKTFEILLPVAALYLALTFPLSRLARRLELRLRA